MSQTLPKAETLSLLLETLHANRTSSNDSKLDLLTDDCQQLIQEATLHQQSSWAAHMTPNLAPYSLIGQQIASIHQGNLLSPELYPFLKDAEITTLDWIKTYFHQAHAYFTHGGSYSNLEALWQARDANTQQRKRVYGSHACHYSIKKACDILGLEFHALSTDDSDRLLPEALLKACQQERPLAIVLNLGTSASGCIDPLPESVSIAADYGCWLHVDAAWGGAVVMLPEYKGTYQCLAQADTVSFDPHKSLFQPRPCSILLSQHKKQSLGETHYLDTPPTKQLAGSFGGELFLPLWLNLQLLGEEWFYEKTRYRLAQARQFVMQLSELTSWPVIRSETGIVCFESAEKGLLSPLVQQGIFSEARVNKRPVYRAVFASYHVQANDLIRAIRPYL